MVDVRKHIVQLQKALSSERRQRMELERKLRSTGISDEFSAVLRSAISNETPDKRSLMHDNLQNTTFMVNLGDKQIDMIEKKMIVLENELLEYKENSSEIPVERSFRSSSIL